MKIGVFTVSMPDYEPLDALAKLAELGYDGVEWRVTGDEGDRSNPSFWSGNRTSMTARQLIARADELKARSAELGLEMPSLGTYIDCRTPAEVELSMQAAVALGARALRVSPGGYDKAQGSYGELCAESRGYFEKVAELAARYGVRATVETHMGQLCPSIHKAVEFLKGLDPQHVGIMWDPGNQVCEGSEVPEMAIDIAGDYLAEVHVKNMCHFRDEEGAWKARSCPVPDGVADWPRIVAALKAAGYEGWLFFEDFSDAEPLDERLANNIKWLRGLVCG